MYVAGTCPGDPPRNWAIARAAPGLAAESADRLLGAEKAITALAGIIWNGIWSTHLKWRKDEMPTYHHDRMPIIKKYYFGANWSDCYDLVEFCANLDIPQSKEFIERCNEIFKEEFSGYRFLGKELVPISNETESTSIQQAIEISSRMSPLKGVNIHLEDALKKLSDRKSPDYRNSIKESILAIEALANIIAGKTNSTLGQALSIIKSKIGLHRALEQGYKSIYGYTSDDDGIRHFLLEESTCDLADAQYMLVSCSAFVNYLIAKAIKAGIIQN